MEDLESCSHFTMRKDKHSHLCSLKQKARSATHGTSSSSCHFTTSQGCDEIHDDPKQVPSDFNVPQIKKCSAFSPYQKRWWSSHPEIRLLQKPGLRASCPFLRIMKAREDLHTPFILFRLQPSTVFTLFVKITQLWAAVEMNSNDDL